MKEVTLQATNRNRKGWTAVASITKGRVVGKMLQDGKIVREKFSVRLGDDGKFKVDIGTGSGVCVNFQYPL